MIRVAHAAGEIVVLVGVFLILLVLVYLAPWGA